MALQVACEAFIDEDDLTCNCEPLDSAIIDDYIDEASDILTVLTGGKVQGSCTDTVRPRNGTRVCGCTLVASCSCNPIDGITLRGPDPTVTGILIDGAAFTDFLILDGTTLIRTDAQSWPGCQDLRLASTEERTFEIIYTYGLPISKLARDACAEIVCSFVGNDPQSNRKGHPGVRGMTIAGVQISLEQQVMEIEKRAFLMPSVIRLLTVYAPDGPNPAVVYSPELEDGWKLHRV